MGQSDMTRDEYRAHINKLGLSDRTAAELFGVHQRTAARYGDDIGKVPATAAKLVRTLAYLKARSSRFYRLVLNLLREA